MFKSMFILVAIAALVGHISGRRNNFRPIDLDNLPPGSTQSPVSQVSPSAAPKSEDFPALSPQTPPYLQNENSGPSHDGTLLLGSPPGSSYGLPAPPGVLPMHNPIQPVSPAKPPGPSSSSAWSPAYRPQHSIDEFPPLGPNAPTNTHPQRQHSPGLSGVTYHSQHHERSPSRSPSPQSSPAFNGRHHPPHNASGNHSYSHLMLALQWSGGVCADGHAARRPVAGPASQSNCLRESKRDHWTIHGLWPTNGNTSPEFCTTDKFDGRRLENIKSRLNRFWPSFTSTQDRFFTFWRHEWQKHGTCATDVPQLRGLVNFFNTVLDLFNKHDITTYLTNSRVVPSNQTTYRPTQIVKAISDDYAHKFDVVCNRIQSLRQPVLSEIRFCLDKNLHSVDCDGRFIRCGNEFYYPPNK